MKRFFERLTIAATIAFSLAGCTDDGDRLREIARVRSHLERVEWELSANVPAGLNSAQAEKRALVIRNLHRYISAEQYPTNRISREMTPIFIDGDGARCAVAALLEASGHFALVERIAGTRNLAYVEELKDEPELKAWLTENGVTLVEAARIQPSYANRTVSRWRPTVSVLGSAQGEIAVGTGANFASATGIRVGARHITDSDGSCDRCVYNLSRALVAEYVHNIIVGTGTKQFALLGQYDLLDAARDNQAYLIGGPLASVEEDTESGFGLGGQVGCGLSFRSLVFPLFAELTFSALEKSGGAAIRGGAKFGVVW